MITALQEWLMAWWSGLSTSWPISTNHPAMLAISSPPSRVALSTLEALLRISQIFAITDALMMLMLAITHIVWLDRPGGFVAPVARRLIWLETRILHVWLILTVPSFGLCIYIVLTYQDMYYNFDLLSVAQAYIFVMVHFALSIDGTLQHDIVQTHATQPLARSRATRSVPKVYEDLYRTVGCPLRPTKIRCLHCWADIASDDGTLTHESCRYSWHKNCLKEWMKASRRNRKPVVCPFDRQAYRIDL